MTSFGSRVFALCPASVDFSSFTEMCQAGSTLPFGEYTSQALLNSADLPYDLGLIAFDLISIPPVSLVKNLRFRGTAWQMGDFIMPANLCFCGGRSASGT